MVEDEVNIEDEDEDLDLHLSDDPMLFDYPVQNEDRSEEEDSDSSFKRNNALLYTTIKENER